jgi:hypothetical protein
MSSNNFVTAIIPQLSSTKAPLPASSLPKILIAFCLLALISASRASTTPKLPHLLAMEDLLAGVVDLELEMEVEMMDLQAISSGLGELQVPESMEMEGPPSCLQDVLQAQEEEDTGGRTMRPQRGRGIGRRSQPARGTTPSLDQGQQKTAGLRRHRSPSSEEDLSDATSLVRGDEQESKGKARPRRSRWDERSPGVRDEAGQKGDLFLLCVPNSEASVQESPLHSVTALFIGCLWEMVWLFLLSTPYAMLSRAQYNCQEKLTALASQRWRLTASLWICALLRSFIIFWSTGKWVAILAFALLETEKGEAFYWNLKVPHPSIIYMPGMTLFPFIFNKTRALYNMTKGLWRQPTRRHRRHESVSMELSGRRLEP